MLLNATVLFQAASALDPLPPMEAYRFGSVMGCLASGLCMCCAVAAAKSDYPSVTVSVWLCGDLGLLLLSVLVSDLPYEPLRPVWPGQRTVWMPVNDTWGCTQTLTLATHYAGLDAMAWVSGALLLLHAWTYGMYLSLSSDLPWPSRKVYTLLGAASVAALFVHFYRCPRYTRLFWKTAEDPRCSPVIF
jgi:hypothetical protein